MRLIGPDGDQLGIKPLPEALSMAREQELDLVEVADKANPPVCRIMDYGKFKYEAAQRAKESRKKSTNVVVKEMKYRPKIGGGDFDTKTRKVEQFLSEGHKVKVTIMFRGREMQHPELGAKILDEVAEAGGRRGQGRGLPQARRSQHDHGARTRQEGPSRRQDASVQSDRRAADRRRHREPLRTPPPAHLVRDHRHHRSTPEPDTGRSTPRHAPPETPMPKMKTHSGAKKRFKVTGKGKITRRNANLNHILEKKSESRKRRLSGDLEMSPGGDRKVRRQLGI